MKYLQDYQEEKQTQLFNQFGVFFAFSKVQLNEGFDKNKANKTKSTIKTLCLIWFIFIV